MLLLAEEDGVGHCASIDGAGVSPRSAVCGVDFAVLGVDRVVAGEAEQEVLAPASSENVVTSLVEVTVAEDAVVAGASREPVVAEATIENIDPGRISDCLLYTSPSPRDRTRSRMPSSA